MINVQWSQSALTLFVRLFYCSFYFFCRIDVQKKKGQGVMLIISDV